MTNKVNKNQLLILKAIRDNQNCRTTDIINAKIMPRGSVGPTMHKLLQLNLIKKTNKKYSLTEKGHIFLKPVAKNHDKKLVAQKYKIDIAALEKERKTLSYEIIMIFFIVIMLAAYFVNDYLTN